MRMNLVPASALLAMCLCRPAPAAEELGRVEFVTSCAAAERAPFNRGVALLHDFWYDEAERQFAEILARDPGCAMAHWGKAMSFYHQIWNRPDKADLAKGLKELQAARASSAGTPRERVYIDSLYAFYAPNQKDYPARVNAYARQMARLHETYPDDVDGTAFNALAVLAAEPTGDTSLEAERQAEALLQPAFASHPDHPGVVHYLIHACDTPSLAGKGLAAARSYGRIAPSGAHAAHMPAHIFARLGMWQEDIDANLTSVGDSQQAQRLHPMEGFDEFHANEFLLYAYLQSGQEARARELIDVNTRMVDHAAAMPQMADGGMAGMFSYYRAEFPVFYYLEMRDWQRAQALPVDAVAKPESQQLTVWARAIAAGHLRDAPAARDELAHFDALTEKMRQGDRPWIADSTGLQVARAEALGWTAHASGDEAAAEIHLRQAADLQDKVGQAEVDIPAREMLADLLLEAKRYPQALIEYQSSLKMSPNRFNGLYNAGLAAEGAGDRAQAGEFYAQLMRMTAGGKDSARVEFRHLKDFNGPTTAPRAP